MDYKTWLDTFFNKKNDFVLITGGSSGIGLEYLRLFAEQGCNCIVVSNDEKLMVENKVNFESKYKVKIISIFVDLSEIKSVLELEDILKDYSIRVLINNAGFGYKGDFLTMPRSMISQMINVNSVAPTLICHFVLPKMKERGEGVVISVATINIVSPIPKNTIYTASKFYIWAFSLALAMENADSKILFQTMLPGTTDTPFHLKQGASPSSLTMQAADVAMRSLSNLDISIFIPNKIDRIFYPVVNLLPVKMRMHLASYMLKKRLGVK